MAKEQTNIVAPTESKSVSIHELCKQVDAITDPKQRKAFFLAHPELESRYSAANFKP